MNGPARTVAWVAGLVLTMPLVGCSDTSSPEEPQADPSPTTKPAAVTYDSKAFVLPLVVTPLPWMSTAPSVEQRRFVTWETADAEKAVRFLVPVTVYPPGGNGATAPPQNYLTYLLSQRDHGANFTDIDKTRVGGHPATLVTATAREPLDGSLGCQMRGLSAADCFGLQPELALRIAVVDAGATTLLVWLRKNRSEGSDATATDVKEFEDMLASLRFSDRSAAHRPVAAAPTPIDGVWQANVTLAELKSSPLLIDQEEINDWNWGTFTLSFKRGRFTEAQKNPLDSYSFSGTFEVHGDVLAINRDNGEHFVMRWSIQGNRLKLTRDETLGIAPTPFFIDPWVRQS